MCGIGGLLWRGDEVATWSLLEEMQLGLSHRGPDATGATIAKCGDWIAGLAHTRLSIIGPDVPAAIQPSKSADGRFTISFNGEIYNYRELGDELARAGQSFDATSDTSVLLAAFAHWGLECLPRLRGMFAFAIWDAAEGVCTLVRDAMGMKPLWIARHKDGAFVFGSEISPLLKLARSRGEPSATLSPQAIAECLVYKYVPGNRSLVEGICGLAPGSWMQITLRDSAADIRQGKWYTLPVYRGDRNEDFAPHHTDDFEKALRQAVSLRLRADVPLGVFLSGGLDSSTVYALAAQELGTAPHAFFVEFVAEENSYSERWAAEAAVNHLGGELQTASITASSFADSLYDATRHREAPLAEMADTALFELSKLASRSVKTVLSGEGADELLAGYPRYWGEHLVARMQRWIPSAIDPAVGLAARSMPYKARRLTLLLEALRERDFTLRQARWFGAFTHSDLAKFAPALEETIATGVTFEGPWPDSPLQKARRFDMLEWLPSNLLSRGDRMTMASGLEMRMPFMDTVLGQVASTLPSAAFVRGRTGKMALRAVAARVLPSSLADRPKSGFRVPFHEWARGPLRDFIGDHLLGADCRLAQYADQNEIAKLIHQHNRRERNEEKRIWAMLSLELSLRQFETQL